MNETLKPVIQANLPPRFRETTFRFYEPYIAQISLRYPARIDFDPSTEGLSSETFACRLRDAMLAYIMYGYSSTKIDYDAFKEIHPHIIVSQPPEGGVACGSRTALRKEKKGNPVEVSPTTIAEPYVYGEVESITELKLLCRLASERLLTRKLRLSGVFPTWANKVQSEFDVDLEVQPDGTTILS
jgi:hypothetical protein